MRFFKKMAASFKGAWLKITVAVKAAKRKVLSFTNTISKGFDWLMCQFEKSKTWVIQSTLAVLEKILAVIITFFGWLKWLIITIFNRNVGRGAGWVVFGAWILVLLVTIIVSLINQTRGLETAPKALIALVLLFATLLIRGEKPWVWLAGHNSKLLNCLKFIGCILLLLWVACLLVILFASLAGQTRGLSTAPMALIALVLLSITVLTARDKPWKWFMRRRAVRIIRLWIIKPYRRMKFKVIKFWNSLNSLVQRIAFIVILNLVIVVWSIHRFGFRIPPLGLLITVGLGTVILSIGIIFYLDSPIVKYLKRIALIVLYLTVGMKMLLLLAAYVLAPLTLVLAILGILLLIFGIAFFICSPTHFLKFVDFLKDFGKSFKGYFGFLKVFGKIFAWAWN